MVLLDIVNHRKEVSDLIEFFRENCVTLDDDYYDDDEEEIANSMLRFQNIIQNDNPQYSSVGYILSVTQGSTEPKTIKLKGIFVYERIWIE